MKVSDTSEMNIERKSVAAFGSCVHDQRPAPARVVTVFDDGGHLDRDRKASGLGHVDASELRLQPIEIVFDDRLAARAGREQLIDARRLDASRPAEARIVEEVEMRRDAAVGEARRHAPDGEKGQIGGLVRERVGAGAEDRPGPVGFGVPVEERAASQAQAAGPRNGKAGVSRVVVVVDGDRSARVAVSLVDDFGHELTSGRERRADNLSELRASCA